MATLSNPRGLVTTVAVVLVCIAVVGGALLWRQNVGGPELRLVESPRILGRKAAVDLQLRAQGGNLSTVRITLEQGDQVHDLFASDSLRTKETTLSATLDLRASGASEGEARLVFYVGDDLWRPRNSTNEPTLTIPVLVDLTPPPLQIRSATRYPEPGGAALVVLFAPAAEACFVEIAGRRFPAYARGVEGTQVSLYAVPLDYDGKSTPIVVATDAAGNRSVAELPVVIRAKAVPTGSVDLSEEWLTRKLPELLETDIEEIRKDVGAAFRRVSVDLRAEALAKRETLAATSTNVALWSGAFRQLPNSSVLSRFGVRRTYRLGGQELDEKIHQGFDLASVRHAKIPAANAGRVVWAGPLTIYGNTVIIDHGLGLMTLYGHCSSLQTAVGDTVERGQTIAHSGATGLAVGDHLHFEVVVGGVPVTPLQWFDRSWIESHIESVARDGGATLRDSDP